MKRRIIGFAVVVATVVVPFVVARPASAVSLCNQCEEQAIINAVRCMSSGPFWRC